VSEWARLSGGVRSCTDWIIVTLQWGLMIWQSIWSGNIKGRDILGGGSSADIYIYIYVYIYIYIYIYIYNTTLLRSLIVQCNWIKIDQLDVTCFIISLFNAQHVSDVNTSILRSLRLICELFHGLYCSGSMCVGVTVWFGWGGVVSVCRPKL